MFRFSRIKLILLFLVAILLADTGVSAQQLTTIPKGFLIICGDRDVIILNPDLGSDSSAIVWRWSINESKGQTPDNYQKWLYPLDDCKPIDRNRSLLLTSSGGATCIVNIKNRKVTFYARTPMAHSADVLPGRLVAVANSTNPKGNSLEIYNRNKPEMVLFRDSLYSGHGAVWNSKRNLLYALGFKELRAYKMSRKKDAVHLTLVNKYELPDEGGHELSPADEDRFIITTHNNVFVFDIPTETFSVFKILEGVKNLKSVNYSSRTQYLVYTRGEESWWTHHVRSMNPERVFTNLPIERIYKVRVAR